VIVLAPSGLRAGPWLIGKNNAQAKFSFFFHSTDEEFILIRRLVGSSTLEPGEKLPYPFNGESISRAYLLELRYGAFSFLDFRVLFSYYDLQFNDDGGDRRDTGFGDLYAESELGILRNPLAVALRAGVKAPTGEFTIDPQRVPLSENQWDVEGALSVGRSFYPTPAYAKAEVGYRYRFENTETKIKPGNELFFLAETGVTLVPPLLLKIVLEGLFADERESREFGFLVRNSEGRQVISLAPFVTIYPMKSVFIEGGAKFLLSGRDYPAGVQYLVAAGWRRF
jgi:hypothetical protein